MKTEINFLRFITKGFKSKIGLIVLIELAEVLFSLAFVWFSKVVIDIATGERLNNLFYYSILLISIVVLQIILRMFDIKMRRMSEVRLGNSIRYSVFSRLLYSRWQELSKVHSGDMLTRIIKDTDDVVNMLVTALPLSIAAITQFAGALVILFILDPMLALIIGIGIPLLTLFARMYYTKMRKYTVEVKENESVINSMVEESLMNQVVIRTFERQESELSRLEKLQTKLHNSVEKRTNVSVFANLIMGATFSGGYITAFIWSAYGLAAKTITFGTVTAYLQLVNRIQRPLFDLIRLLPSIVSAKTAVERLVFLTAFELESNEEKIMLDGNITLKMNNIKFAYTNDGKWLFPAFSMEVKPGSMVAITGETGAGKTTLLRLLLALLKPESGTITIENETQTVEVSERTRSNFVYVPQGNSLFSGTIRDNLLLGNSDASDEELLRVLEIASAAFVAELPDGLDTKLGENGAGISEGQAQRIAIARSLLRPGKILLFDEATSALDAETEHNLLVNLKREIGNRTLIFITHQPEVASFCDYRYSLK